VQTLETTSHRGTEDSKEPSEKSSPSDWKDEEDGRLDWSQQLQKKIIPCKERTVFKQ